MAKKPKPIKRQRSAITGEYVTDDYARRHPTTTVTETDKPSKKPKKPPKKKGG